MTKNNWYKFLILSIGSILFVVFLVLFIQSKYTEFDGFATDISFNEDYLVCMIVALLTGGLGLVLVLDKKKTNISDLTAYTAYGVATSSFVSFYSLGVFLKKLTKAIQKNKALDMAKYGKYLIIGLVFLAILIAIIVTIVVIKNKKKNTK